MFRRHRRTSPYHVSCHLSIKRPLGLEEPQPYPGKRPLVCQASRHLGSTSSFAAGLVLTSFHPLTLPHHPHSLESACASLSGRMGVTEGFPRTLDKPTPPGPNCCQTSWPGTPSSSPGSSQAGWPYPEQLTGQLRCGHKGHACRGHIVACTCLCTGETGCAQSFAA